MPIKNEKAEVVLFLVSHKDITKSKTLKGDDSHKGENCPFETAFVCYTVCHDM